MEKLWFIYCHEEVSGPYSTDEVKRNILAGKWTADAQVWWKGQKEWLALDKWHANLEHILEANRQQGQQPVWYAERGGQQTGPMTKNDLVNHLKTLPDVKNVRLWTVGLNHWSNLFEFHEIVHQLGITKRGYDRAPIMGQVQIQRNGEVTHKPLASVSGGGLGVRDAGMLGAGEIITVAIQSPLLIAPVRATAKVMYVESSGYAGLQFQQIHIESKTTLMDYVRQFRTDTGTTSLEKTTIRRAS